jgi:hypothetical protein
MKSRIAEKNFLRDVFPAELAEIADRRREAGDDRELPTGESQVEPNVEHDLTGLAFSGGGIRSASFSLGVVQHLLKSGWFKYVDYLSSVSGGGYTGACISSLMQEGHQGERLLVDRTGLEEPQAVNHIRNGSNFLIPGGMLNRLRMPSLYAIGLLQSLLLFLPPVILLVFLTELVFELSAYVAVPFPRYWLALLGLVPLAAEVITRPISQLRYHSWESRDRADRRAGFYLVLAIVSLIAVPVLAGLDFLVDSDVGTLFRTILEWLEYHFELWPKSWLVWVLLGVGGLLIASFVKFGKATTLALIAISGPLFLVVFYLICCVFVIDSPNVQRGPGQRYVRALIEYQESGNTDSLQAAVNEILVNKQLKPANYQIDFDSVASSDPEDSTLEVNRLEVPGALSWWHRYPRLHKLTTKYQEKLTITQHPWRQDRLFIPELSMTRLNSDWIVYLGALLLWLFNYLIVNVNRMSLHPFYRDRLSRTFLIRRSGLNVESADALCLSELRGKQSAAPYHLVNTALNLQGTRDPQLRQRKTVPFLLSKLFCGSDYTGFCDTEQLEDIDRNLNLGTAMAVSAGAAGPTMGVKTVKSFTFIMTLLNIRLAYWLPNPSWVGHSKWWHWFLHRNPGLSCLLTEALGTPSDRHRFLNCSDGGHIENLGVYELLKRRCRTIVCVDGGADPKFKFFDLTTLQRYANIDLNVQIDINPELLLPNKNGISKQQYVLGKISYPNGQQGTLIYLKLAYCDQEPEYIRFYKRSVPAFPHESTADQFFNETKFEVYRALGEHVAQRAFADAQVHEVFEKLKSDA